MPGNSEIVNCGAGVATFGRVLGLIRYTVLRGGYLNPHKCPF
jgi:hypothetical protein